MRSQIVTASKRNLRHRPFAFTEHGAIMAANILNSSAAVQMSVFVVRAFIKMRAALTDTRELARKLVSLERELKSRPRYAGIRHRRRPATRHVTSRSSALTRTAGP
jgi:hypothetical protein